MIARMSLDRLSRKWPTDPEPDVVPKQFFDRAFMAAHTQFDSFDAFVADSPVDVEAGAGIGRRPSDEFDRYVSRTTQFDRWVEMRNRAAEREIRNRLLV